jgi:hypothetical protein
VPPSRPCSASTPSLTSFARLSFEWSLTVCRMLCVRGVCGVCVCVCVVCNHSQSLLRGPSCKEEVLKLFYDTLKSDADILLSRAPVCTRPFRHELNLPHARVSVTEMCSSCLLDGRGVCSQYLPIYPPLTACTNP